MDFEGLTRRELQALCKKNKIPANQTNVAMAQALRALSTVEGIEVLSQQQKGFQTPAPSRANQRATTRKKAEIPPGAVVIELEDSAAPVSRVKTSRRTAVKSSGFSRGVPLEEERVGETKNDADLELVQSPLLTGAATAKKTTTKKDTKSLIAQSNLKVRRSTRLKSVYNATDEVPSVVSKCGNKMSAKVSELIEEPTELTENLAKEAEEATTCVEEGVDEAGLFRSSNGVEELLDEPEEITENLPKEAGEAATDVVEGVDEADLSPSSNIVNELLEESEEITDNLPKEAEEAATNIEGVVEAGSFSLSNGVKQLLEEPEEVTENLPKEAEEAATNVEGVDEAGLFSPSNGVKEPLEEPEELIENLPKEAEEASDVEGVDEAVLFSPSNGVKDLLEEPEEFTDNLSKESEEAATNVEDVDEDGLFSPSSGVKELLEEPGELTENFPKEAGEATPVLVEGVDEAGLFPSSNGVKELPEEPEELTENLRKEAGEAATSVEGVDEAALLYPLSNCDLHNPGGETEYNSAVEVFDGVKELLEEPEELTENLPKEAGEAAVTDVEVLDEANLFPLLNGDLQNTGGETESYSAIEVLNGVKELLEEPEKLTEILPKEAGEAATDVNGDLQNPGGETESCSAVEVLDGIKELFEEPEEFTEDLPKEAGKTATNVVEGLDEAGLFPLSNGDLQNPGGVTESCSAFELVDGVKELFEEPEELTEDLPKEAGTAATNVVEGVDEAGLFPLSNGDLQNPGGEAESYLAVKVLETMSLTEENKAEVSDEREEGAVVTSPSFTNSRSKKMDVELGKEAGSLNQEENVVADTEAAIRELSGQTLSNPGLNVAELDVPSSCNPTATPSVLTAKVAEKTPKKESVLKAQVLENLLTMGKEKKTGATPGKSDEEKKPTEAAADKENNGGAYGLKKEGVKKPLQENLKDMSLRKLRVMYKESFSALQPLDQNCLHGDGNARK